MGFYLDMTRVPSPSTLGEIAYRETEVPSVFWILYFFAAFALTCMGLAAFTLLRDLASQGSAWDLALVGTILSAVPFFLAVGLKLAFLRKFAAIKGETLSLGYLVGGTPRFKRTVNREAISAITLVNQRPSSNVAPVQHRDSQYYIRGHWRILVTSADKAIVVDKHTDPGALEPLYRDLLAWWSGKRS